jgi:hypothetical protein
MALVSLKDPDSEVERQLGEQRVFTLTRLHRRNPPVWRDAIAHQYRFWKFRTQLANEGLVVLAQHDGTDSLFRARHQNAAQRRTGMCVTNTDTITAVLIGGRGHPEVLARFFIQRSTRSVTDAIAGC